MAGPSGILVLVVAGLLILGLCTWRLQNPRTSSVRDPDSVRDLRPAPVISLYDQNSSIVNLQAYLRRHRIVLVFFDGQAGPEADAVLRQLREFYPSLKSAGVVAFGVSTALPQEIRKSAQQPFPFPLLSDVAATDPPSAHRQWGRLIEPEHSNEPARTNPGVFVVNRAGLVEWEDSAPKPVDEPSLLIPQLLETD